jgi:phage-related baseplate assembly protein
MADFELDDLIQPVTRAEVQQSIYDVLGIVGVVTTTWKPGAVVRTIIVAVSAVLAALSNLQANICRSGFLQFSSGSWLTLVARYGYGVERLGATFASGSLTLVNGGGGVYTVDPDDWIFLNTATNKTYRNTQAFTLNALQTLTIQIQATEAGADSSADPGEIAALVTTILNVTCSNAGALTGTNAESDPELRSRAQQKLGALSPMGPWDAYTYAVRSATREDGTPLGINRVRIVKDGSGHVWVYVASVNGEVPGDVDDPTSDLGIAMEAVQRKAAPLAVTAEVISATAFVVAVTYELWMYNTSALSGPQITEAIDDAIEAFLASQPIGGNVIGTDPGKVFINAIEKAIFNAIPEIFQVTVSLPLTDEELDPNDVPIKGSISGVVHEEPPPEGFGGDL